MAAEICRPTGRLASIRVGGKPQIQLDGTESAGLGRQSVTSIIVPMTMTAEHEMARPIGLAAAGRIAREIGHGQIEFPLARNWELRRRVLAPFDWKLTEAEIARRAHCHARTVRRYRRRAPTAAGAAQGQRRALKSGTLSGFRRPPAGRRVGGGTIGRSSWARMCWA